ncbi:hypothetical protein SCP_1503300 [Sparassis crispa]|uniref:Uncharacterized protein n=1 Tax=Sparassis crispa TaxID=139825 RepID=A0A401H4I4_9APHY|nr:hypothetical protein SCP_1503300 [Sparassis crispa]GBE89322.1 hypothetical protein SCP_1503300 [Sparassis crispa]
MLPIELYCCCKYPLYLLDKARTDQLRKDYRAIYTKARAKLAEVCCSVQARLLIIVYRRYASLEIMDILLCCIWPEDFPMRPPDHDFLANQDGVIDALCDLYGIRDASEDIKAKHHELLCTLWTRLPSFFSLTWEGMQKEEDMWRSIGQVRRM